MGALNNLSRAARAVATGGGSVINIIGVAAEVAMAAKELGKVAKPLVDEIDKEAVAAAAKDGAQAAARGAAKVGGAVAGAAGHAVKPVIGAIGGVADNFAKNRAAAQKRKEALAMIEKHRRTVLENAASDVSLADLLKAEGRARGTKGAMLRVSEIPGCFVIATYKTRDASKNYADYVGIYVGRANNCLEGVLEAASCAGDPDVYADVKYRQNVHAFIYYCKDAEVEANYAALCQIFDDERRYGVGGIVATQVL